MNFRIYVSEEKVLPDLKNDVNVKLRLSLLAKEAAELGTNF